MGRRPRMTLNEATCPISNVILADPICLPACGHTFDKKTINKIFKRFEEAHFPKRCPVCRSVATTFPGKPTMNNLCVRDLLAGNRSGNQLRTLSTLARNTTTRAPNPFTLGNLTMSRGFLPATDPRDFVRECLDGTWFPVNVSEWKTWKHMPERRKQKFTFDGAENGKHYAPGDDVMAYVKCSESRAAGRGTSVDPADWADRQVHYDVIGPHDRGKATATVLCDGTRIRMDFQMKSGACGFSYFDRKLAKDNSDSLDALLQPTEDA